MLSDFLNVISGFFAIYAIIWGVPGVLMSAVVGLGNVQRIVFIDKQLAKNLDKLYDEKGYLRWQFQTSYSIVSRLTRYWIAYPFIRYRVKSESKKFRLFMWINSIGIWSWLLVPCLSFVEKLM
ncbi:TPA: hypothetical protein KD853_003805 [Vibrio parahaemolyticus]|nr:hypothetical protein [Vibrio parahaemolyticus]EKO3704487.1 hypothetical protein [Vibrio metschnikovii]MEB5517172.1 hypothetical protein [Vibrio cholerae]NOI40799.1 hypothetical protein [Vibrio sp. 070316B]PWY27650.1 hypothetical protein VV97_18535 [Vibrio vulnificus]